MRGTKQRELKLLVAGVVLALASCNPTSLDDPDSADVVLEVFNVPQIPPVTAAFDSTSNVCTFTVTSISATLQNRPKNDLASTSPFNDVVLQNVVVTYGWDAVGLTPLTRTFGLGGTIPVGSTGTVNFPPIALGDLTQPPGGNSGHSASLAMVFHGRTVSGKNVSAQGGGVLSVSACVCPDTDGDGVCDSSDSCPGCNNPLCTGVGWCTVPGNTCTNLNPTCP